MMDENICSHHKKIIERAEQMINFDADLGWGDIDEIEQHINKLGRLILDDAEEAYSQGQRMERRLKEYRKAIEGLGFKRSE